MKILVVGSDNSILDEQSALAKRACEYAVVVERYTVIVPSDKKQTVLLSSNCKAYAVTGKSKFAQFFSLYKKMCKAVRQDQYDVISAQDCFYFGILAVFVAARFSKASEVQVHGTAQFVGWKKRLAKFVLKKADVVRTVSKRTKVFLQNKYKLDSNKIVVVPIFSDPEKITKIKKFQHKEDFKFLTVGRLVSVKNIELQIQAMKVVHKYYPHAQLVIVGNGPQKNILQQMINENNLERVIKLVGKKTQEQLSRIYKNADCFVLSSNSEGWGLVIVEATQHRLPVIMTDVGCAGELIEDGVSGRVVEVGDLDKLMRAMLEMIELPSNAKRYSDAGVFALEKLPSKEETLQLYLQSWEKANFYAVKHLP